MPWESAGLLPGLAARAGATGLVVAASSPLAFRTGVAKGAESTPLSEPLGYLVTFCSSTSRAL